MPLLPGPVRSNSAAGPGGRPPSFPRKRVGGAPGVWLRTERQVRKNRSRSYMNGSTATACTNTVFTETATATATDTQRWKSGITKQVSTSSIALVTWP